MEGNIKTKATCLGVSVLVCFLFVLSGVVVVVVLLQKMPLGQCAKPDSSQGLDWRYIWVTLWLREDTVPGVRSVS